MSKNQLMTVAVSVGVIALMYRNPTTKNLLTGNSASDDGWFSWL